MACSVDHEQLARYAAGELPEAAAADLRRHVDDCADCRQRLSALQRVDKALSSLRPEPVSPSVLLNVRRAMALRMPGASAGEVMTLDQVAQFLGLTQEQMAQIADQLPAFELAGQVRVRRSRLLAWIEKREREYGRQVTANWAARAKLGLARLETA